MRKSMSLVALLSCICCVPNDLHAQTDSTGKQSPFSLGVSYTGNMVTNLAGGIRQGTVYSGMGNLRVSFNTASAGLWYGGELFLNAANTHGGMPSAVLVGDYQGVSNIEAGGLTYLHEFWFKQSCMGIRDHDGNNLPPETKRNFFHSTRFSICHQSIRN